MQAVQALCVAQRKEGGVGDEVHQELHARAQAVRVRVVGVLGVQPLDLLGGGTKGVDVLVAYKVGNLDVCSVQRAEGHGSVEHELHVRGARGFL